MLSNNQLKYIRSLHQAKYRILHQLFLAEGPKIVKELFYSNYRIKMLIALDSWITTNNKSIPQGVEVIAVSQKELERVSTLKNPNEVIAIVHMDNIPIAPEDFGKDITLVLDGISDPGNLGTILRTADWFGIDTIICSPNCVDLYNPKVVQASMGSIARVRVEYHDLISFIKVNRNNLPVYGALLDGENVYDHKLSVPGFLVIGSESHGISSGVLSLITDPVSIPTYSQNKGFGAESLNASVATAIFCAEFRRPSK